MLDITIGQILNVLLQHWPITFIVVVFYTMMNTWAQYLAVTHLKKKRDELRKEGKDFTTPQKVFGYPILARGLIWDVFLNIINGFVFFFELPRYDLKDKSGKREILFTARVSRWNDRGGKRGDFARWNCFHFLNPFDKRHCK